MRKDNNKKNEEKRNEKSSMTTSHIHYLRAFISAIQSSWAETTMSLYALKYVIFLKLKIYGMYKTAFWTLWERERAG